MKWLNRAFTLAIIGFGIWYANHGDWWWAAGNLAVGAFLVWIDWCPEPTPQPPAATGPDDCQCPTPDGCNAEGECLKPTVTDILRKGVEPVETPLDGPTLKHVLGPPGAACPACVAGGGWPPEPASEEDGPLNGD